MRLGKFVEHFKAAAVAADSKSLDPVLKYLAVGRQLGYAVYLSLDALTYLDQTGIKKFASGARLQREAYRAWFAGLACNIAAGLYTLYNLQLLAKKQQEAGADAEKAVEGKKLERYVFICSVKLLERENGTDICVEFLGNKLRLSCSCFPMSATLPSQAARLVSSTSTMALLAWPAL